MFQYIPVGYNGESLRVYDSLLTQQYFSSKHPKFVRMGSWWAACDNRGPNGPVLNICLAFYYHLSSSPVILTFSEKWFGFIGYRRTIE